MKIIELTDYTMVIEREEDDNIPSFDAIINLMQPVKVCKIPNLYFFYILHADDYLVSPDVLVLYFKDKISDDYHINDKVDLKVGTKWIDLEFLKHENSRIKRLFYDHYERL